MDTCDSKHEVLFFLFRYRFLFTLARMRNDLQGAGAGVTGPRGVLGAL